MRYIQTSIILVFAVALSACAEMGQHSETASSNGASGKGGSTERTCHTMKSKDGDLEGCVYGNPPATSKFSKLTIGMTKYQAEKLLGRPQDLRYVTNWRKAWIPFYQGTDARRLVWLYEGQGSVSFDTDGAYTNGGVIVEINYDPKIEL